MNIGEDYIVDEPSPDKPLLVKDGEEFTGEDSHESSDENRVIWKGSKVN